MLHLRLVGIRYGSIDVLDLLLHASGSLTAFLALFHHFLQLFVISLLDRRSLFNFSYLLVNFLPLALRLVLEAIHYAVQLHLSLVL